MYSFLSFHSIVFIEIKTKKGVTPSDYTFFDSFSRSVYFTSSKLRYIDNQLDTKICCKYVANLK